jgi:hypothetical protein
MMLLLTMLLLTMLLLMAMLLLTALISEQHQHRHRLCSWARACREASADRPRGDGTEGQPPMAASGTAAQPGYGLHKRKREVGSESAESAGGPHGGPAGAASVLNSAGKAVRTGESARLQQAAGSQEEAVEGRGREGRDEEGQEQKDEGGRERKVLTAHLFVRVAHQPHHLAQPFMPTCTRSEIPFRSRVLPSCVYHVTTYYINYNGPSLDMPWPPHR